MSTDHYTTAPYQPARLRKHAHRIGRARPRLYYKPDDTPTPRQMLAPDFQFGPGTQDQLRKLALAYYRLTPDTYIGPGDLVQDAHLKMIEAARLRPADLKGFHIAQTARWAFMNGGLNQLNVERKRMRDRYAFSLDTPNDKGDPLAEWDANVPSVDPETLLLQKEHTLILHTKLQAAFGEKLGRYLDAVESEGFRLAAQQRTGNRINTAELARQVGQTRSETIDDLAQASRTLKETEVRLNCATGRYVAYHV
jgi:hypothetical protein